MTKYEARHPGFRQYTEYKIEANQFIKWLGFRITLIEPGYIEGELEFKDMHRQQNGWLHGGVTSAILDMVEGYAAYTLVNEGQQVFTAEASASYYHPGIADKFFARGWVDKAGKAFHFCEGELYYLKEHQPIIVAKGKSVMAIK